MKTASTSAHSQAHFTTINHQTRIVSIFGRPTELEYKYCGPPNSHHALICGLTKRSAKNRQNFTLTLEKWWLEKIHPLIKKKKTDMIRPVSALGRIFPVALAVNSGHPASQASDNTFQKTSMNRVKDLTPNATGHTSMPIVCQTIAQAAQKPENDG